MKHEIDPSVDSPGTIWYEHFLKSQTTLFRRMPSKNSHEAPAAKTTSDFEALNPPEWLSPGLKKILKLLIRTSST